MQEMRVVIFKCLFKCHFKSYFFTGETMSDDELREMIERADSDGDGEISFEDFYTIMTKRPFS